MTWLWLLILLLSAVEGKNLQKEDDKEDGDDGSADSEEGNLGNNNNNTQGAQQRSAQTDYLFEQRDKRLWAADVRKQKDDLIATLGDALSDKDTKDLTKRFDDLATTIVDTSKNDIGKTLEEVQQPADKKSTANSQQNLNRIKATTQIFMDSGPTLYKNIKKKDGWATAATVCTMISGAAAIVPHPIGIITSMVFGIAAFFINLGNKKTVVKAKEDPYKEIYAKIDEAVKKLNEHSRKIALSKLMAPLTLAQRVSQTFLSLSGKRLSVEEFNYWLMSNNFPSMNCFVDTLAEIRSYLSMMREELKDDRTQQGLLMVYAKICIIRDIVLSGVDILFPWKPKPKTDPNASPGAIASSEPVEYPPLVRLKKEYQDSLNRQKRATFEFLIMFHEPKPKLLPYIGWYYPPNRPEGDASVLYAYLRGLSYVDDDGGVHMMPPVTINTELLKLAKFTITVQHAVYTHQVRKLWFRPSHQHIPDAVPNGKGVLGMVFKEKLDSYKHWFTFVPTDGYVKILYDDIDLAKDRYAPHMTKFKNPFELNMYDDRAYIMGEDQFRADNKITNKFTLIPILDYSGEQAGDPKTLKCMLGRGDDDTKYLAWDRWRGNHLDDGDASFVIGKQEVEEKEIEEDEIEEKEVIGKEALILYLTLQELKTTIPSIKTELMRTYEELGDGQANRPKSIVDLKDSLHDINDALHFCQLLGKCKK